MPTNIDEPSLDQLERLLAELADLQQQLVDAAKAKQEAMRQLDRDALAQATQVEQHLLARIGQVESARRRVMASWSGDAEPSAASLDRLEGAVDPPRWRRLTQLRSRIKELAGLLRRVNEINRFVSQHCLEHFQTLLHVLTVGGRPAPVYTARGAVSPVSGSCLLDQTA